VNVRSAEKKQREVQMNGKNMTMVAWPWILILVLLVAGMTGCTSIQNYYPIVPHSKVFGVSDQKISVGPSVAVQWEFLRNGKPLDTVTRKWAAHVETVIRNAGVFSRVVIFATPTDYTLLLTMNNVVDSYAGAIVGGLLEGLTFGLIGSKVTDDYVCTATLTKNGKSATKEYMYGLTSTSGLIVSGVEGVESHKQMDDAFTEIIDQFLLKSIADFRKDGNILQ
jgi:hypothetical protein